jgi:N-acetylglucosaminyl-diphospho-decaprenol L-rhamnosyltransferase
VLTLSVVSHAQAGLVAQLLGDIAAQVGSRPTVVATVNIPEPLPFKAADFPFPLEIVHNALPKGFGANHNAAFARCRTPFFCILNPDIRLASDPFPALLATLQGDPALALAAPLVRSPAGEIEASSRRFPTPSFILRKALLGPPSEPDYPIGERPLSPDWVGGMFMLLRAEAFRQVGGFDERYFMYYEDVDLCARLQDAGFGVVLDPAAEAIHAARRDSHRRPRHLGWHLRSMLRFWMNHRLGYRR